LNIPPWLKSKKALAGVGAAGLLGAFVLLKNGGSGASAGGTGSGATVPTSASGSVGAYDSTSADIANQLGQYQTGLQTALGQYGAEQQATLGQYGDAQRVSIGEMEKAQTDALKKYQDELTTGLSGLTSGTGQSGTTTGSPSTSGPGLLAPGYGWFATGGKQYTVADVAKRYNISVANLVALNPSLKGKSTVAVNTPVKVRSNAAAWNLAAYRKVNK
jgi:hypothetical protein